jgi:2-oxoglutarate ferredoxin oxidoreductase subunit beta
VAFNNHTGSTKSYDHVRAHSESVVAADYFTPHQEITADYEPGTMEDVRMPDGSVLRLRKLENGYDPHDRLAALSHLQEHQAAGEVVTGLLFVDPDASDCHEILDTVSRPLNDLDEEDLCPGSEALAGINESFR